MPYEATYRSGVRFDGAYRWFRVRVEPARDSDGRIVRWYSLVVDVHGQKLAETALLASERDLKTTLNNIPGEIMAADGAGKLLHANRRMLDYVGIKASERHWVSMERGGFTPF